MYKSTLFKSENDTTLTRQEVEIFVQNSMQNRAKEALDILSRQSENGHRSLSDSEINQIIESRMNERARESAQLLGQTSTLPAPS